jgi:hypothetical protein
MKRKNREINIFSMSALDLFASAMGAFVIIAVVMFPYFPNTGDSPERVANVRAELEGQIAEIQQELEDTRDALAACQAENAELEAALSQCENDLAACQEDMEGLRDAIEICEVALQKTYLVVIISWGTTGDDVDLHVIDPLNREYYYAATEFPGSPARLEEDNVNGPGNEVWQHPEATPGRYEVYYNYFDNPAGTTNVRGFVLHKDGRTLLPDVFLSSSGERPLVATIYVDTEGNVTVR